MKTKKILANTLCASMMISSITPTFASVANETNTYDDTTTNVSKETEVLYQKSGNYFVTIPKTISLGADKQSQYSVKVEGDISSDKQVYVSPIDEIKDTDEFDFYMHDQNATNPKADVVATVTQNKFYWNFSEVADGYTETNNQVTAKNLTSGTWKGTFNFEINMKAVDGDESHTHHYTETIIKEPTCTEEGEKKLTCSCGDTKIESIPSTGHNMVDGNCTECGAVVKTVEDLMNGDVSFDIGTVLAVAPTDILKVNDIVVPEQNFTFDKEGDYKVTVESTDADGTPVIININITVTINQGSEHTHSYTETIIKEATCTESGEKQLTCSCGDSKTESIPSTGHNYGADDKCTNCGELNPNHNHNYTETIIKEATCTEDGEKNLTCSCGDTKTESIPSTGHNYENGTCTKCGETEYIEHEHNFVNNTYNANWIRDFDGTNGYRWDYESATANSTRYKSNSTSGVIGNWNSAETIWKITVPVSCTTQIGFKPNSTSDTKPSTFIYLNDKEIWNNIESYASSSEYKYRYVTLQPGDNYVKAIGYRNDCIELFKVSGEYEICSICGEEPLSKTWNYTLNETDKTITLNRYIGEETDVIVHSNYLIDGTTYKTKIAANAQSWSTDYMFGRKSIKTVKFEKNIELPDSIAAMFRECSSLTNVDMSNLDTSNVTNMSYMFYQCTSLTSINLSDLDTSNVINMSSMFSGCSGLTSINLSGLDTSKVTDMSNIFYKCSSLTSINLSNFNTSNVINMSSMFGCSGLTNLDLSNFDTSNVKFMNSMFNGCSSLTSLDLSNFNTTNLTNMYRMFYGCSSLTSLDLSNFETSQVINMDSIFYGCTSLNTIYVTQNKWLTGQADTTNMFKNCGTSSVIYK